MKKKEKIDLSDCPDDYVRRRDVITYILGRYDDQLGYLTPKEMAEQIKMIKEMEGKSEGEMNEMPWYFGIFDQKYLKRRVKKMPTNDLEKFRLQTYTRAQADLAERIRFRLMNGDTVDVLELLDEVERKGKEMSTA